MKSKFIKIICAVLVVCVVVGGGAYYLHNKSVKAKAAANASMYYTVKAEKSNIDVTVSATGTAEATQTKDIVANNNGIIENFDVKEGDTVTQGQTIAKVQSDDIDASVSKANLTVEQQQLQVNNAKGDNDKQMQQLSLDNAQSDLNNKLEQQNKMTLTSPINGVIVSKTGNNGDNIQQGTTLVTVADLSSMKVDVQVDELDISKVKVGQTADIKFDAISDKTYTGTVQTIAQVGTTTNNVTTYDVTVVINNPSGIRIGMNANVDIKVSSKADALTIPVEALIQENGKKYVMVKSGTSSDTSNNSSGYGRRKGQYGKGGFGGRLTSSAGRREEVTTGLQNETTVEITSGLNEGDEVMVELPQTTSSNSSRTSGFGGFGGLGGGLNGSGKTNRNSSSSGNNTNSSQSTNSSNKNGGNSNNSQENSGAGK